MKSLITLPFLLLSLIPSFNLANAVSLKAALEDQSCFGKNSVNQELWTCYVKGQKYKRVNAKTTGGSQDEYRLNEMRRSR